MTYNPVKIAESLVNTTMFGALSNEMRQEIASKMLKLDFEPRDNIVVAGEKGDALYLIVDGLVEVLGSDYLSGEEFVLAHLGPGDCFGEMSLLTGEKRSATVRAFEQTLVLQLDSKSFDELLLSSSHMGLSISKILAERLAKLNQRIEELKGQQTVINKMLNTELDITSEIAVMGRSNAARALMQKIEEISNSYGVWAIKGPSGIGKSSIARVIHRYGIRLNQPMLILDCASASHEVQRNKLMGTKDGGGYLTLAQSGTVILTNSAELDEELMSEILSLNYPMSDRRKYNTVPLVLCLFKDTDGITGQYFTPDRVLDVPPLSARKQDIPIISKKLLERYNKTEGSQLRLSSGALAKLLEHNWPENFRELESIIEQSIVLTRDSIINENNIIFDLPTAMQNPYLESVKSLAIALDAKDPYTAGHSERVARYSQEIGRAMGLPEQFISNLYTLALFHDVGKIGVSENILRKQSQLTEDEYIQIQKHPESSMRILQPLKRFLSDIEAVLYHHTHFDGSGYPGGISEDSIPIGARIIAVADTFDAMTTDRPYRKSLPLEMAKEELGRVSGKQLDPGVTTVLLKIINNGKLVKL